MKMYRFTFAKDVEVLVPDDATDDSAIEAAIQKAKLMSVGDCQIITALKYNDPDNDEDYEDITW